MIAKTTQRLNLTVPAENAESAVLEFYRRNAVHLSGFGGPDYARFTPEKVKTRLAANRKAFAAQESVVFYLEEKAAPGNIVGTVSFYDIFRDDLQLAYIGYAADETAQGKGFITEGAAAAIAYVFDEWNIHKLIASYKPVNRRSAALAKRLGFRVEGYAHEESFINGVWEDAIQASLINDNWDEARWRREQNEDN